MATYTWVRQDNDNPLRRHPTRDEIRAIDVMKRCNGCKGRNRPCRRVCRSCREPLQAKRVQKQKRSLDDQIQHAETKLRDWQRTIRVALTKINEWSRRRERLAKRKIDQMEAAAVQDRATLVRPGRRALRVRDEGWRDVPASGVIPGTGPGGSVAPGDAVMVRPDGKFKVGTKEGL